MHVCVLVFMESPLATTFGSDFTWRRKGGGGFRNINTCSPPYATYFHPTHKAKLILHIFSSPFSSSRHHHHHYRYHYHHHHYRRRQQHTTNNTSYYYYYYYYVVDDESDNKTIIIRTNSIISQLRRNFRLLWKPNAQYHAHSSPQLEPLLNQMNSVHSWTEYFYLNVILVFKITQSYQFL